LQKRILGHHKTLLISHNDNTLNLPLDYLINHIFAGEKPTNEKFIKTAWAFQSDFIGILFVN